MARLVGVLSCTPRDCGFGSWLGHVPIIVCWIPGWGVYARQPIDVSLTSMFLSLPSFLPKINKHILG